MFEALLFVHIAFAATLFGAPLGLVRNLKTCLAAGPAAFKAGAADASKRSAVAAISAILVFLSGIGLILVRGGFGGVPKSYHISMTIMLVMIGIGFGLQRPTVGKIAAAANADTLDQETSAKLVKKLAMGGGILQLLWTILLLLMIKPF